MQTFYALQAVNGRLLTARIWANDEWDVYSLTLSCDDDVPFLTGDIDGLNRWINAAAGGVEAFDVSCDLDILKNCKVVKVAVIIVEEQS